MWKNSQELHMRGVRQGVFGSPGAAAAHPDAYGREALQVRCNYSWPAAVSLLATSSADGRKKGVWQGVCAGLGHDDAPPRAHGRAAAQVRLPGLHQAVFREQQPIQTSKEWVLMVMTVMARGGMGAKTACLVAHNPVGQHACSFPGCHRSFHRLGKPVHRFFARWLTFV